MPQHHNQHNQQDQENHDDCEDCKRQHAQNQTLIQMYQKLQSVDQKTQKMKSSIREHQKCVKQNVQGVKKMEERVELGKTYKIQQNHAQLGQLGFKLCADMIEKERKSEAQKENQRLKLILKNIYQEREQKTKIQASPTKDIPKQSSFISTTILLPQLTRTSQSTAAQWFNKSHITQRTESRKSQSFRQTEMGKSFEISSTKSSFNMTKRKTFEKKDFQELNLWLFEQRHQILEKELYDKPQEQGQVFKQTSLGKTKGAGRYANNAKNTSRLGMSTVLRRNSFKKQHSPFPREQHNDSQMKQSSNIQSTRGALPDHISSPRKFYNTRIKRDSIFPAISSK